MINSITNQRELAYVIQIDKIQNIIGSDNCECAVVNGWNILVKKGEFKQGDPTIYFEIDSKVDSENPAFEFLAKKHFAVKTQKYTFGGKGNFISQGLIMKAEDFGWTAGSAQFAGGAVYIEDADGVQHFANDEDSMFLTEKLNVTYYVPEDNARKSNKPSADSMLNRAFARHPKIAKKWGKFIKNHKWARKLFLLLFGKKKDVRNWIEGVPKTDEERIENRVWTLEARDVPWIATEKIDGTSTTFYLSRSKGLKKGEYLVCSRNVVFDTPEKGKNNYYMDTLGNIYLEMSEKYNVKAALEKLLASRPSAEWVAVQAETFGMGVQKRDYGMKDHEIRAFNLRYSDCGRVGTLEMKDALEPLGIPCVPIISEAMTLPPTVEELREFVHSAPSAIDGGMKEGIVFRSLDGSDSFKCVDPEFLVKFHQ